MAVSRRTVTVLFADVADSTPLGERLDPEALRQVMGRFFETSRVVLERHGGTVEKFIGDAVMAVFGVPQLHEDDPVRAVRAAAELHEELERFNDELERRRGVRLGVRVGINTGEVVAAAGRSADHLVTGDTVNVAKRLEQAAVAGQVLVGAATERLSRGGATFELVEQVAAKGKSVPIEAWRLVDVLPDEAVGEHRLETPLVGRRRELDELRRSFEAVDATRSCNRVTLLGPAGIGKSRLATEFCAWLGNAATVLSGRCLAYGDGITFWPIIEMLRQLGGAEEVHRLLASSPDGGLAAGRLAAISGDTGEHETQETFWAVRTLFEALARTKPLVVCVEDVHWAQPTLLDLLEYLLGWARDAPILLLCLARPEFVEERPGWMGDGSSTLTVPPLTSSESEQLLDSLGASGSGRARIADAAEGNPLYAEQMAAMIAEGGYHEVLFEMPPSIQALLAARLDRLEPAERAAIERAAVAGKEFSLAAIVELTPSERRAEVGRCLLSLVRKGLIRPHRSTLIPDDAFRFGHVLIRDAAYAGIAKEARADLHERFADWVERRATTSEFEEIVAYHLEQAYRCREEVGAGDSDGLRARARDLLALAGGRAAERGDAPAAANLLGRAVDLTLEDEPTRVRLMIGLGAALRGTGRLAEAQGLLDDARRAASALGDRSSAARATLESAVAQLYTWTGGLDDFLPTLDAALAELEAAGDDDGISRALTLHAQLAFIRCRMSETQELLERALNHSRRADNKRQVSEILGWLGRAMLRGPQRPSLAKALWEEARKANAGDRALDAALESQLALLEAMRGQFEAARALSARSRETFHDLGRPFLLAIVDVEAGIVELLAGDVAAAERSLRAGYDALESIGERGALSTAAALLAEALYEQRADEDAAHYCAISGEASLVEDVLSQVLWRSVQAKLACRRESPEEGEQLAREAVALARETDDLNLTADALTSLGTVLTACGRARDGAAAYAEALELYERKENVAAAARARDRAAAAGV